MHQGLTHVVRNLWLAYEVRTSDDVEKEVALHLNLLMTDDGTLRMHPLVAVSAPMCARLQKDTKFNYERFKCMGQSENKTMRLTELLDEIPPVGGPQKNPPC